MAKRVHTENAYDKHSLGNDAPYNLDDLSDGEDPYGEEDYGQEAAKNNAG